MERSDPAHQTNTRTRLQQLRTQFASLPFDDRASEEYGKMRAHLEKQGQFIGPNDLLIASIAQANGLT